VAGKKTKPSGNREYGIKTEYILRPQVIFFMRLTTDYTDYRDTLFLFYFFLICVNLRNLRTFFQTVGTGPGPAPTKNKWRELMRRCIGCFTSYYLPDYLFSSLPLPNANCFMAKDLCKTKKIEITDYADYTDFFRFFHLCSLCSPWLKKNKEIKNAYKST
jgi:hypothetical protein